MQGDAAFAIWARESQHAGSLDDRSTVDEAIQWIDGLDSEPFFIAMNFQNSHLAFLYRRSFHALRSCETRFHNPICLFSEDKIQVVKDVYADSLAYVDSQIAACSNI